MKISYIAAFGAAFLLPTAAYAQLTPGGGGSGGTFTWPGTAGNGTGAASTGGTMPYVNAYIVNGGSGGGFTGFTPTPSYANGTTSSSDQNIALPTGTEFIVYNTGSQPLAYNIAAAATVNTGNVPANSWAAFAGTSGAAFHYIEGQGATGTTTFVISGGAGLPIGAGGGSSGGGSGSNASVVPNGTAASSATQVGAADSSGNTQPVSATAPLPATITNTVTVSQPAVGTAGAAGPASLAAMGANGNGGPFAPVIQAGASVPISISTATTTQLVALASGKAIYITAWDVIAAGTGNITLEYGTGSNCGTGTTALTGAYNLAAQAGISKGVGLGSVLIVPASNALCALTSAAVQMSGSLSYTQY